MSYVLENSPSPTSAVELMVIGFEALAAVEQDDVLSRLQGLRLKRNAGEQSEGERMLASLQRVAQLAGRAPEDLTSEDYRTAIRQEIAEGGAGIEPISKVIKHFGSWRLAKEALSLSGANTARQIEARFECRRLGRVHRYSEEVMRETLERCRAAYEHRPTVGEFKVWRQREMDLARAQGNPDFYLPGINAYRSRNKLWRDTLAHYLGD